MADAGPSYDEDGGQCRPGDQAHFAGRVHPAGHGCARPVREYRKSRGDRIGNAIFSGLARVGIGPAHLLTTRGRKTGRLRTTPVILVVHDQQRWLVAPYGAVPWVLNARAAGQVRLRRGRDRRDYTPPAAPGRTGRVYPAALHSYRPGHAALLPGEQGLPGRRFHRRGGPSSGIRTHPPQRSQRWRQCQGERAMTCPAAWKLQAGPTADLTSTGRRAP